MIVALVILACFAFLILAHLIGRSIGWIMDRLDNEQLGRNLFILATLAMLGATMWFSAA